MSIRSCAAWILSSWFVLSILGQHPGGNHRNRSVLYQLSSTIYMPNWSFFAPNPGIHDDHLFYRLQMAEGNRRTEWREIELAEENRFVAMFYSRRSRALKGIIDLFSTLEMIDPDGSNARNRLAISEGRVAICNFVLSKISPEVFSENVVAIDILLVRAADYEVDLAPVYHYKFTQSLVSKGSDANRECESYER